MKWNLLKIELVSSINNLINNYKKRKLMNKKGREYIDGKGLMRVVKIFIGKIIKDVNKN